MLCNLDISHSLICHQDIEICMVQCSVNITHIISKVVDWGAMVDLFVALAKYMHKNTNEILAEQECAMKVRVLFWKNICLVII